jgi:hypothetical protein
LNGTVTPDALTSLRESFALQLDATRKPKTARIYLDALDNLIRHLGAHGMPVAARGVRREHVESYLAARKPGPIPPERRVRARHNLFAGTALLALGGTIWDSEHWVVKRYKDAFEPAPPDPDPDVAADWPGAPDSVIGSCTARHPPQS